MPIHPLPQFEADLKALQEEDRKAYEALKAPKTMVVRFGAMKLIGEYPYDGSAKPGCGSKVVVRTHRGTEIGEMLTSTCPNAGCSKSVTRKEMLEYIENSGGRDYPFFTEGRVLRVATMEDLDRQAKLEQSANAIRAEARRIVEELGLPMKIVEVEPILGGERLTFFYLCEERVDFRELVRRLGEIHRTRIEMRQVGARDEARLTADYEKCGQYCCCKNFLKVLKPISMKSAKVQKATLDPLKISGRCGRLMCCLRYEDQTYAELHARLPKKKTRVGTPEGDGLVIDTQILTQLALVQLDADGRHVAVPVEDLTAPAGPAPAPAARPDARPGPRPDARPGPRPDGRPARPGTPRREGPDGRPRPEGRPGPRPPRGPEPRAEHPPRPHQAAGNDAAAPPTEGGPAGEGPRKRRRKRRRRRGPGEAGGPPQDSAGGPPPGQ